MKTLIKNLQRYKHKFNKHEAKNIIGIAGTYFYVFKDFSSLLLGK